LLAACICTPINAQEAAAPQDDALRVFLDCQYFCDFDHLRTEITFVNWVRDRADAQVHVLVTRQTTGGGGSEFTLAFIGLEDFAGREDTLQYVSLATDVPDETRNGMARTLSLGLVRYAAQLPVSVDLRVVHGTARQQRRPVAATAEGDPWNFWVFNVSTGGNVFGEETYNSYSVRGSVSASRVTEDFKFSLRTNGSYSRDETNYEEVSYVDTRRSFSVNGLGVWSIGEHFSAGLSGRASSSTRYNQDLVLEATPAIEYDVFPYSESTRRQLTLQYSAGVRSLNYEEVTIFGEMAEVRPIHQLEVSLYAQQPWGRVGTSVTGFQYLHDLARHHLTFSGDCNIRLFKGFSFNVFGSVSRVKDQIYLSGAGISEEDILVRRRQLGTNYTFYLFPNIRYQFGSIFNNVVNPRFGGGGGGGMIIMN
jgi:hypothetical protein